MPRKGDVAKKESSIHQLLATGKYMVVMPLDKSIEFEDKKVKKRPKEALSGENLCNAVISLMRNAVNRDCLRVRDLVKINAPITKEDLVSEFDFPYSAMKTETNTADLPEIFKSYCDNNEAFIPSDDNVYDVQLELRKFSTTKNNKGKRIRVKESLGFVDSTFVIYPNSVRLTVRNT